MRLYIPIIAIVSNNKCVFGKYCFYQYVCVCWSCLLKNIAPLLHFLFYFDGFDKKNIYFDYVFCDFNVFAQKWALSTYALVCSFEQETHNYVSSSFPTAQAQTSSDWPGLAQTSPDQPRPK